MLKINKTKIIAVLLLFFILLSNFTNLVTANTEINSAVIKYSHDCGYHLQFYREDGIWAYVITSYVYYTAPNGNNYPAYCLESWNPGVSDSVPNYNFTINQILSREDVRRVAINGYPYVSAEGLGVENNDDAFVATKHAIYSVLYNHDVRSYYRGGDERGRKIVNAIERLVNIRSLWKSNFSNPSFLY